MMVGNNLKDNQLQQIVDKTILFHDKDGDGKISFDEFCDVIFDFNLTSILCNFSFYEIRVFQPLKTHFSLFD